MKTETVCYSQPNWWVSSWQGNSLDRSTVTPYLPLYSIGDRLQLLGQTETDLKRRTLLQLWKASLFISLPWTDCIPSSSWQLFTSHLLQNYSPKTSLGVRLCDSFGGFRLGIMAPQRYSHSNSLHGNPAATLLKEMWSDFEQRLRRRLCLEWLQVELWMARFA